MFLTHRLRVYEGHFSDSKLRSIFNIQDWLLAHGKVECFSGKDYPVDSALDRFRFSKREIEVFRPEYRYVHFDKAKEVIENHLGEPDKAERFLIRNLEFNKIGAYHPLFGRVLPENSLAGERWRKCFVPEWQLCQLTEDLPAAQVFKANRISEGIKDDEIFIENGGEQQFASTAKAGKEEKPWLIPNPKDPKPEQDWYVPARYFAREQIKKNGTLLLKRELLSKKVAESLIKVRIYKRGGKLPLKPQTILKAFSGIDFG
jgi:hypothetical protein